MPLKIHVNENAKTVSIWLTNAEKADAELIQRLKPLYREYRAQKYLVAVFESGGKDLYQSALDLLAYNKKRTAELEVQCERTAVPLKSP